MLAGGVGGGFRGVFENWIVDASIKYCSVAVGDPRVGAGGVGFCCRVPWLARHPVPLRGRVVWG